MGTKTTKLFSELKTTGFVLSVSLVVPERAVV